MSKRLKERYVFSHVFGLTSRGPEFYAVLHKWSGEDIVRNRGGLTKLLKNARTPEDRRTIRKAREEVTNANEHIAILEASLALMTPKAREKRWAEIFNSTFGP
jgi:hypothetical protein